MLRVCNTGQQYGFTLNLHTSVLFRDIRAFYLALLCKANNLKCHVISNGQIDNFNCRIYREYCLEI